MKEDKLLTDNRLKGLCRTEKDAILFQDWLKEHDAKTASLVRGEMGINIGISGIGRPHYSTHTFPPSVTKTGFHEAICWCGFKASAKGAHRTELKMMGHTETMNRLNQAPRGEALTQKS